MERLVRAYLNGTEGGMVDARIHYGLTVEEREAEAQALALCTSQRSASEVVGEPRVTAGRGLEAVSGGEAYSVAEEPLTS